MGLGDRGEMGLGERGTWRQGENGTGVRNGYCNLIPR